MKLTFVVIVTVFCCGIAQDVEESGIDSTTDDSREIREFNSDNWRAVDNYQPGESGWIPHTPSSEINEEVIPKRRRLRKRKKRPPVISLTEDESTPEQQERMVVRRRLRPLRIEPWEAIEEMEEIVRRPYVRRRVPPKYEPPEEIITSEAVVDINPLAATLHFEEDDTTKRIENEVIPQEENENPAKIVYVPEITEVEEDKNINLKNLLKQSDGTLSLSEILQQKNLSLSELLMGNKQAISALTEKPEVTEAAVETATDPDHRYKRLPPSIGLRKHINRNYEQDEESYESLSAKETLEAQRKRLALLHGHKESKVYSEVTKYDVITEPSTEKRIFVPSHPKYYTSLDYKPSFKNIESITEPFTESTTTTTTTTNIPTEEVTRQKFKFPLPLTNYKLNKMTLKPSTVKETVDILPQKAVKINIKDVFGFKEENNQTVKEEAQEEPLKISLDLENVTVSSKVKEVQIETTTMQTEKLKIVTAKEEIMEILKDPISREKLSRILETRNMTIQELVEQRERGSSQLHLADIFHNNTKEPEPNEETFIGRVTIDNFDEVPSFERRQKSISNFEKPSYKPPELIKIKPDEATVEVTVDTKPKDVLTVTSFPTFKIEINKNTKAPMSFQWPELYPSLFPKIYESGNKKISEVSSTASTIIENDIQRLEEVENKLSSLSNNRLNIEAYDENDYVSLPSGVKSAIIASVAVISASLLVFVTILLVFRWTQKHKQRLNYSESLSSKIKSPILQNTPKKKIQSFMNETLGKKKNNEYFNYNKQQIMSRFENVWVEDGRKQSF